MPKPTPAPSKWPKRQAPSGFRLDKELIFRIQREAGDASIREGSKVTMRMIVERALLEYLKK